MVGLERGTVRLVPYTDEWAAAFETEAERLRSAVDCVAVEHVGSTAIEGMRAKPVVDLLLVVEVVGEEEEWTTLDELGYEFRPNDGVADRLFFAKGPAENRTHYLSVTERGSDAHVEQLSFRDYLRANPAAAERYERLKRELAAKHPEDRASYTEAKSRFVRRILRRASEAE